MPQIGCGRLQRSHTRSEPAWASVVELVGYDLDRDAAAPGETLHVTLVWRCLGAMDDAYTVFTHLLDQNEQIRGQKDNPPAGGAIQPPCGCPARSW